MKNLTMLHMRNTHRNLTNMPPSLETLTALTDLDLSCNQLPKVPDALYTLTNLKRLNLSSNVITELSLALGIIFTYFYLFFNLMFSLKAIACAREEIKLSTTEFNPSTFHRGTMYYWLSYI